MQDFPAVLGAPGSGAAELRVRRLTPQRMPAAGQSVVRAALPGLLDTRLVRAELSRLRGPAQTSPGRASGASRARGV